MVKMRMMDWLLSCWFYLHDVDLLPGRSAPLRQAERLARVLLDAGAQEVQLFGSVARTGYGKDIDLICVVDQATYQVFKSRVLAEKGDSYGKAGLRFSIALDLLAGKMSRECIVELLDRASWNMSKDRQVILPTLRRWRLFDHIRLVDIFLLPDRWEVDDLDWEFPMDDPCFFEKIAGDARYFDPFKERFDQIGWRQYVSKYSRQHPEIKAWLDSVSSCLYRLKRLMPRRKRRNVRRRANLSCA